MHAHPDYFSNHGLKLRFPWRLYHAPIVDEGRRAHDLRRRLQEQITRARQLYDEKVSPAIRRHADYFEQELVRTLADGDPVLLGQRS